LKVILPNVIIGYSRLYITKVICGYFINDYWWLLMVINIFSTGGCFLLNYHKILMTIVGTILLMVIVGYSIVGH